MRDTQAEKRQAGVAAADEVHDGMALGLGSGSTVFFFLEELGRRVREGLRVQGVPTSISTARLAGQFGIPLTTFDEQHELDLDVDGADEVDPQLNLIKGHGGALLREKIIALAARRRLIIVDETKISPRLGNAVLPVEVVPFARGLAERGLHQLGGQPRLRQGDGGQPFVTDNANWILDCRFGAIDNPAGLEAAINRVPGVMDNGLFVGLADEIVVARATGLERLVRSVQTHA